MAAECVSLVSAAAEAGSQSKAAFYDPFMDILSLSKNMNKIHGDLNCEMKRLHAIWCHHNDTLHKHRSTKGPSKIFQNWNDRVMTIEDEVKDINMKYETKKQKSSVLVSPRAKFSRKMKDKSSEVSKLSEEGINLKDILVEKEPERVHNMMPPDIKEFTTLQEPLKKILHYLQKNDVKGIRVHGMVGTGKTVIMQNLNNHERIVGMFDIVFWVKVSTGNHNKSLSTGQMQQTILRRLNVKMEGTCSVDEVAHRIQEELRDKKYLLLLINVNEDLNFEQIGIHPKNGSKIVLTTTNARVCRSMMDRGVNVKTLPPKEALKMFKNVLGDSKFRDHPDIEPIIVQIVEICGGLPLAINKIASTFKMRDNVQRWRDGLKNLRKWPEKKDVAMVEIYKFLNFCCDELDSVQRKCFFYSAIYPEDSDIHTDCLLDCWAAEDLYGNADDAEEVGVNCRDILEYLKTVSLLEECAQGECVRIHTLIRQAALYKWFVDGEPEHLVKTGKSLQEPPKAEDWEQKNWISLGDNKLEALPQRPDCSTLSTLFLQENPSLKTMSDLFFEHMLNLRVLNLCCTGITSLPSTISKLTRLKVLYLNGCADLVELPSQIGELEDLEVLDIRGSGIQKIPCKIENLRLLRRLLLSFTNFGNENDTQDLFLHNCSVISQISLLEELVVDVKSYKQCGNKMLSEVRDRVSTLTKLTTLKFCFLDDVIEMVDATPKISFPNADCLINFDERIDDLDSTRPFQVFIGCLISSLPLIPKFKLYKRYLRYCDGEGCNLAISKVLAKADAFELVNHNGLEHVSEYGIASMDELQGCLIKDCHTIATIMDGSNCNVGSPILPKLKRLCIENLPELKCILKGPVHRESLSNLISLDIGDCSRIEELFIAENACILPNLRKLKLVDLPIVKKICTYATFEWPALEKLQIHGCPNLIELPFNKDNALQLTSIEAEKNWWEALQRPDPEVKELLKSYCYLS